MITRILLYGNRGRMGQAIAELIHQKPDQFSLSFGIGRGDSLKQVDPREVDVAVDFSTAEAISQVIDWCEQNSKPLVSGTTGLDKKGLTALEQAAKKIPVLWAANMSLGVAVVQKMLKSFSVLTDFDFQIEEIHHRNKRDSPSGTALLLQKTLQESISTPLPDPVALRGGGVFGVHRIYAMAQGEVICLEHQALGREVFAQGALTAAHWLKGRTPGRYEISDILEV